MDYNTKQREIILDFLIKSENHVTVADIEKHLSECGKRVGRATIYRYLNKLTGDGVVRKFASEEGAFYQYVRKDCHSHYHFVCNDCGKLIHVQCDALDKMCAHVLGDHGFKIDMGKTIFCGECSECAGVAK